jgi:hypothetical protein
VIFHSQSGAAPNALAIINVQEELAFPELREKTDTFLCFIKAINDD